MPPQGGYIVDTFDAYPTTVNLIALDDDSVIGGMRITKDGEVGMASDKFLDFRTLLPDGAIPISCGMLCLRKQYRGNLKLLSGLLMMGAYWATAHGATHVCAPINPLVRPVLRRVGFEVVGEQFEDECGLPTIPMILDLEKMNNKFMDFIRKQGSCDWLESFEHEFFAEGETIIQKGDRGTDAYVLIDGEVEIQPNGNDLSGRRAPRIEPGSIFGELSLLNDLERSSTVVAQTPTEVMVLDRESFYRQLESSPEMSISLLKLVGARLHETVVALEA